tara:strand:- start:2853 stop:3455 length:603 start_codon:yes stop_codon:yes gene_type:complete
MRAFLWCNGDTPSLETIKSLGNLSPLFGVDGGTIKAKSCGFIVKETLGDLDSISKDSNIETTYLSDDSYSDLTKTIQELSKRGYLEFDILGIDGGSPGHILGIWGTLAESVPELKIRLHHHDAVTHRITSKTGEFQIYMKKNQYFSVFALTKCEKISIKGAKWELKSERLEMSTKGLHNEGNDQQIMIDTDGIIALIIEK